MTIAHDLVEETTISDLMMEIQVSDDWEAARLVGNNDFPENWLGVSDRDGRYIAYFANESDAFGFRLWLINCRLNGRESAARYSYKDLVKNHDS